MASRTGDRNLANRGFLLAGAASLAVAGAAQAQTRVYSIPAGDAATSLQAYARQSGRQVLFPYEAVRGKRAPAVSGAKRDADVLAQLAAAAGLVVVSDDGRTVTLRPPGGNGDADAGAEPIRASAPANLDELIVTASKRSERLVEVPMSVVALGSADLERRNVTNLLDITRLAPGIAIQDQGPGQRRIFMRGIGNAFGNSSLVGLYLDEASVSGIQDAEIDLRTYDLERVEVLRGPQGTLYGEGSTAGTIRFITAAPSFEGPGGFLTAKVSTTHNGGTGSEIAGAVNVPVVADKLAIRLAGELVNTAGWIDQPAQGRNNINDQDLYNVRLNVLYRPVETLTLRLTGIVHHNDAGAQNSVSDRSNTFVQVLGRTASPTSKDDYNFANATVTYRLGDIQLLGSSTWLNVTKNLYNQGSSGQIAPPPAPRLQVGGDRYRTAEVFSHEFRISRQGERLNWLVGAFYRDGDSTYAQNLSAGFGTPLFNIVSGNTASSESGSLFGNVDYRLTDELTLGGGVRYFRDERETFNGTVAQDGEFESVSPRVYVKYAFDRNAQVYASAAKGFRSGGFNGTGQPTYDPEFAWTYELGGKINAMDGRLSAEVSVFHTDYKDVQIYQVVDFVTLAARFTNAGNANVDGIEGSLTLQASDEFSLGFSGSYNKSKFTSIRVGSTHAVGDGLDLIPKYNTLVWAAYDIRLPSGHTLRAFADYSVQGKSKYRNRTVGTFYYSESDVIQLLNASLEAEVGAWRGEIFASNLLDEDGYRDAVSINGDATQDRPRTFGVSLSRRF